MFYFIDYPTFIVSNRCETEEPAKSHTRDLHLV